MKLNYILAEKCHVDEICGLFRDAIAKMDKSGIPQWDEVYPCRSDIMRDVENKQMRVCLADGKIAAVYTLNQDYDEQYNNAQWQYPDASFMVLHRLCVSPSFQHQGIAAKLLAYIEDELRKMNIETVRLDAFTQNPYALKLYEKAGYVITGTANFRKGLFYLMEKKL